MAPFLSIVVPAFNEEQRLTASLSRITAFIQDQKYAAEAIIIDNASTDGTKDIIMDFACKYSFIKYYCEPVRGKGTAVRRGVLAGEGEYILFSDADLSVPIEEAVKFFPPRSEEYDIAIGSRETEGARRYDEPIHRHLMGRVFNMLIQMMILPGIRDTQCGFKCFRRDVARDLFKAGKVGGWSFDVEILYIARLRGYRIAEIPVNWYYGDKSKVNPVRDSVRMLREIVEIKRNGDRGVYGKSHGPG